MTKKHLVDLAERAGATFAQAFLASITVGTVVHITEIRALEVGGVAGAYSVAKYLLVVANTWLANHPANAPTPPVTQ